MLFLSVTDLADNAALQTLGCSCHKQHGKCTTTLFFFLFFFFLRTLLLDTGRLLLPGWEFASTPFLRIRARLRQDGATAGPLPSGGCDQHRFLVDCSSPTSLPLVQPTFKSAEV